MTTGVRPASRRHPPPGPAGPARRGLRGAVALALAAVALAGCAVPAAERAAARRSPEPTVGTPVPAPTAPRAAAGTAFAALQRLAVKGRAPRTGYDRDLFGPRWADVDRNGCDTRNDVLGRDLTDVVVRPGTRGCVVVAGTLLDPYTGRLVPFRKEQAAQVQVDHVVSLSDAWQTGARSWSPATRTAFANDPLNLLAVTGSVNAGKSDSDAASWLPPHRPGRCAFVARQVAVKARYRLWVKPAERAAIARVLSTCPGQPLPGAAGVRRPAG